MIRLRSIVPLLFSGLLGCSPGSMEDGPADGGEPVATWHPSIVRARSLPSVSLLEGSEDRVPTALDIELFDDTSVRAELSSFTQSDRGVTWIGRIPGVEDGEVVLTRVAGRYAGTVRSHGALYQLLPTRAGHVVVEQDESRIPDEARPADPPALLVGDVAEPQAPPPSNEPNAGQSGTRVDVLVVYTDAARAAAGDEASMAATIELARTETNLGYARSDVAIDLHVVHSAALQYDESHFDWATTLSRLQGTSDGFLDEVHALRDQYGADHVVLIVETVGPYAGIGYQMSQAFAPYFSSFAFSVVARSYATGAYTFAHELGHNMGANHDHANAQGQGFFHDSYGLQMPSHGFRTIMAYSCNPCTRVNHWSNPNVTFADAATGVADWADNARTLNHTASIVGGFREQIAPPPAVASMIAPTPGDTLLGAEVTFQWTDVGASAYRLSIGDEPGDGRYLDESLDEVSLAVTGLPTAGETLYARLWTRTSDDWLFQDYVYHAATPLLHGATLAFPEPGSTVVGSAVPFFWWDSGATGYRLSVGTAEDPTAYFDRDLRAAHWAYVAGLPFDGSPLVARITAIDADGVPAISDTSLVAYTAPAWVAVLDDPAPGALLAKETTFRWHAAQRAEEYWLSVRDEDGTPIAVASTRRRELTIGGLPMDGRRIAVTLHALRGSAWAESSASYTMLSK